MTAARRVLYFDASQGASGDMILGALVDLGVPLDAIRGALETLPLPGWKLESGKIMRQALSVTKVDVVVKLPNGKTIVKKSVAVDRRLAVTEPQRAKP